MPYQNLYRGRRSISNQIYSITTVTRDRRTLFHDFAIARLMANEMRYLHEAGEVSSLAWVIMPDHLHWLFQFTGSRSFSRVMQLLKGRSSRRIGSCCNLEGGIWQREFYDRAIRSEEDIKGIARYIVANPLRAKLVTRIGDYPHWDCAWL